MAFISVPLTRIRLKFHLAGEGARLYGSNIPYAFFLGAEWSEIAETYYIPNPTISPNNEVVDVNGFGNSLFFKFPAGTNLGGGIQAFMSSATSATYGEIKIAQSSIYSNYSSPYVNNCATFEPRSLAGVTSFGAGGVGRNDIWWDYENYYPGGFELVVNSKSAGYYRGISDQCGITPGITTCRVNGNGPDGTNTTTYFEDGGTVGNLSIFIPWKDILAVTAIFVYFVAGDPGGGTPPPPPPPPPPAEPPPPPPGPPPAKPPAGGTQ